MKLEEIQELISKEVGVLLYFWSPNCSICNVLKPKISQEFEKEFPLIKYIFIDNSQQMEVSAHFNIFSAPAILVFLDGKEFAREGRNVSVSLLIKKIQRIYKIFID